MALSLPSAASADEYKTDYDAFFQQANKRFRPEGPDWRDDKAQAIQESALNPMAVSPVGAAGLMQLMPGTFEQMRKQMGWGQVSPFSPEHNITLGVLYQTQMDRAWARRGRTVVQRHPLGLAAFNSGIGNIIKAQEICHDAALWRDIAPCMIQVTGKANARQTLGYVTSIARWRALLGPLWPCQWTAHRGGCAHP